MVNNNIKEPICSFNLSKALREHGFNMDCSTIYFDGELCDVVVSLSYSDLSSSRHVIAPTHNMAILWVETNFKIQLFLDYFYYDGMHYGYKWVMPNGDYGQIWIDNDGEKADGADTKEEATEYALIELLTNKFKPKTTNK